VNFYQSFLVIKKSFLAQKRKSSIFAVFIPVV